MSTILGIDPGSTGGIAVVDSHHAKLYELVKCGSIEVDTVSKLADLIDKYKPSSAVIERVAAFPGQGASSTFTFGVRYGLLRGVLMTLKVPLTDVPPQTWQKVLGLSQPKSSSKDLDEKEKKSRRAARRKKQKELAYQLACQLYHDSRISLEMADGVLLAEYGKRKLSLPPDSGTD